MTVIHNPPAPENGPNPPPAPPKSNEDLLKIDKIIEIDKIAPNSVIVFKIKSYEDMAKIMPAFANFMKLYGEKLSEKDCSMLVMRNGMDLELLNQDEMEKAGWQRIPKSNLILPS